MRKIPFAGIELTSQRVRGYMDTSEVPGVLVHYCCFRLTSGASTAVGPYIIPRKRKRFFLSQSTLREEFVEKKYQVFDVGPLIILVQVNLSSPVERV